MPKVSPVQDNFSGGEFSPLAYGRTTSERYKTGVKTLINYLPLAQGGVTRRGGSYFIGTTKYRTKQSRLIPFEFSTTQAYMLEFGDEYIRVHKDYAPVTLSDKTITAATQGNPVVVTSAGHGFSNGDRVIIRNVIGMTELNNREFQVANVAANTFELQTIDAVNVNGTAYTAYSSGGIASELFEVASTPFQDTDVFSIKHTQSADVLYLAHPSYMPRKLTRTAHTAWTLSAIVPLDGPYLAINPTLAATITTLTPSAATGTGVTLTASAVTGINNDTGFQTTDVGRLIRIKEGSTWGYVTITGWTSTTVVTVTVVNTLTNTSAKTNWQMGAWSGTTGYPTTVMFHEDRLCFGGPGQVVYASRTGDYENFAPTDTDGTTVASHALTHNLLSNDVNNLRWITSDEKGLMAGTVGGEFIDRPSNQNEGLKATDTPSAKNSTFFGSADIQPVQIGGSTIFVQRTGKKIRELTYFYEIEGFRAIDLTLLSEHITSPGLVQIAYQKEPIPIMWAVRSDGTLLAMNYEREPEVLKVGWSRHILGGYSDASTTQAQAESVAVIPAPDTKSYDPWIIVKRYVNGQVWRYIEYISKIFEAADDQKDAFFVDSGLTYDSPVTISGATAANPVVVTATSHGFANGDLVRITDIIGMTDLNDNVYKVANKTANTFELTDEDDVNINGTSFSTYVSGGEVRKLITSVSGLFHLEGQTVQLLADGAVQTDVVVSGGRAALEYRAGIVHVGKAFNSDLELLDFEAGSADGTAQGKTKRIHRVGIRLYRSLGLKLGETFDNLDTLVFRINSDPSGEAPPLFSGIRSENFNGSYAFEALICIRQDQPLPSTILSVLPQLHTQDR